MGGDYFARIGSDYGSHAVWAKDADLLELMVTPFREIEGIGVEVAAGNGLLAAASSAPRLRWVIVDPSEQMLRHRSEESLLPVVARGDRLPLATGALDAGACRSGLHYIGLTAGLAELARVLRPGATAVIGQKVADGLRSDLDWYTAVQRLRSVMPREWYLTADLKRGMQEAGFGRVAVVHYRKTYRTDLETWATREGYFHESVARELRDLAAAGRSRAFARRTGFALDGSELRYRLTWAIVTGIRSRQR